MLSKPNIIPNIYQSGNTVRLKCSFTNADDIKVNPEEVRLIIYNYKYEVLDSFLLSESDREDDGEYYFFYTLPSDETVIIYEWRAEYQGEEFFQRQPIETVFI